MENRDEERADPPPKAHLNPKSIAIRKAFEPFLDAANNKRHLLGARCDFHEVQVHRSQKRRAEFSYKILEQGQERVRPRDKGGRQIALGRSHTVVIVEAKRSESVRKAHLGTGFVPVFIPAEHAGLGKLMDEEGPNLNHLLG